MSLLAGWVRRELRDTICLHIMSLILRPDYKAQNVLKDLFGYGEEPGAAATLTHTVNWLGGGVGGENLMLLCDLESGFMCEMHLTPSSSSWNCWSLVQCVAWTGVQQMFSE